MKSAARRALQWNKEGKRGGTIIGLTRARQIVAGESLSKHNKKNVQFL
jgi:DNA-directed RNA polymerase subunit K/omega